MATIADRNETDTERRVRNMRPPSSPLIKRELCYLSAAVVLFELSPQAHATTIVAKLEEQRIILAADTRDDRLEANSGSGRHAFNDDGCKILPLGPMAAAIAGDRDYIPNNPSDPVRRWDALSDARTASLIHGNSLADVANDWAKRSQLHYQAFFAVAPRRVEELASINSQNVLVMAFFVGWNEHLPLLLWEKVYLDEASPDIVRVSEQSLPERATPYTTNAITQELIEGYSLRTKATATEWNTVRVTIPQLDLDWRQVEFFVKATSKYEESVGPKVNILQIEAGGQAEWIQNLTCP